MIGYDDVVSGDSPENKPGISEDRCPESLPADLIDRAVDTALTAMWGDGYEGVEDDVREAFHAAAPLLVEHGRQQALREVAERPAMYPAIGAAIDTERAWWEARIEKLAVEHDEQAAWYRQKAAEQPRTSGRNRKYAESLLSSAESEIRQAERIRSLLTGEGENGE